MHRHVRPILLQLLLLCSLFGGCQSLEKIPRVPQEALGLAEGLIQAGEHDEAVATLDYFGVDPLALEDKAHWYLLAGTATHRMGESWDAFVLIREFIREHRFLPRIPALADLTYDIGESLAASDASFWPFYSARDESRSVLREFVSLYGTRPQMPDALHRLAELAYEDEQFELARQRYTQIITGRYARSVWNTKAAFRVAMCYFRQLEGPEYDLEGMNLAKTELTDFLKSEVENPSFRKQAQVALRTVRSWLAQKHLGIAEFYRVLNNPAGEHHHLLIAVTKFPLTPAAERAGRRLEQIAKAHPATAGSGEPK
jgi:outer membrane protein assembly factor BamD (BamD/ComL family)